MAEKNYKIYTKEEVLKATLEYFKGDELATDVWIRKYCLKDDKNYYELTPDDMHRRIAKELARIELKYQNPISEEEIYNTLKNFNRLVPQGSPMSGIGNNFQVVSLSNCFVIGNEGESDSYGGILKLDQELVQLEKRRGGVGLDLSFVRPVGSPVKNSAITSTGVVPFMERYSNSTNEVAQDGRRGALMESISIRHPDSENFIDAKLVQGAVTGANISIKLHDDFMEAVMSGAPYTQQYPITGEAKYTKVIDAQKLWKKIIFNAWKSAEPGILFWDKILSESIPDCYNDLGFNTISTNPCLPDSVWIMTHIGPRQIKDLLGESFFTLTNGIKDLSTHKGFFYTGNKETFKIKTKKGYILEGTDNHQVKTIKNKTQIGKKYEWSEIKKLKIGDKISLGNNRNIQWDGNGNFEIGWLLGNFVGDGTVSENSYELRYWGTNKANMKEQAVGFIKNNLKHRSDLGINKNCDILVKGVSSTELKIIGEKFGVLGDKTIINEIIEKSSYDFYRGFISGLFDADGTVSHNKNKGINVRLSSSKIELCKLTQRMLSRLGIISTIYEDRRVEQMREMPDGKGGKKEYLMKSCHEVVVSKDNVIEFQNKINFTDEEKYSKLDLAVLSLNKRGTYSESFVDEIISISSNGFSDVYDCQILRTHEFEANGIIVHNCGEIPLCPDDSCRLLAINLFGYVEHPFTKDATFAWDVFAGDVIIAQRLMDDIIDLELEKIDAIISKIQSDPEDEFLKLCELKLWERIKDKTNRGRRTGLGVTGEGDMLAALGLRYGTNEATDFSEDVHKTIKLCAYRSSITMAKERGAFPIFSVKREVNNPFILRIKEDDPELYKDMVKYGRRNIALLTIAPTGTASIMTQTTSGIEPCFLPTYMRRRKINPQEKDIRIDFVDDEGVAWQEYPVFHHKFEMWLEINGYDVAKVQLMDKDEIDKIVKKSPYYKATSNDVDWIKKVEMQGRLQKHIDHSISVTVNLPKEATEELVAKVYETGWKSGCKGITVYRDGSRSGVLVGVDEKKNEPYEINVPKRPKRLKGEIHRFQNNLEKWIAVVGMKDGRPYEIFTGKLENGLAYLPTNIKECEVVKNKFEVEEKNDDGKLIKVIKKRYDIEYMDSDGEKQIHTGLNQAFNPEFWNYAKFISGVLRHKMPIVYVYELIDSLNFKEDYINTWKNGVARVIKKYIKDGEKGKGRCPECGSDHLEFKEGCLTCMACGNSKCG
jgi:ribonucleotide reductase alpha subunit